MISIPALFAKPRAHVLCLGAHSDDIEIGAGGTILRLAREHSEWVFHWVVFSAIGERREEAQASAKRFLGDAFTGVRFTAFEFKDGFMPYLGDQVKGAFEAIKRTITDIDLVFTHQPNDAHQDHRLIAELTGNTFRNHVVLQYEIPKYDGDLGRPNFYVPLDDGIRKLKVQNLMDGFASQRSKHWFDEETFNALMRLRGLEYGVRYAEAFYARKTGL